MVELCKCCKKRRREGEKTEVLEEPIKEDLFNNCVGDEGQHQPTHPGDHLAVNGFPEILAP